MINFKLSMEEDVATRSAESLCASYNYVPSTSNILGEVTQNPETPQEFAFRKMVDHIKDIMIYHETKGLSTEDKNAKILEIRGLTITLEIIP